MSIIGQQREPVELPKRKVSPALKFGAVVLLLIVAVGVSIYFWTVVSHGYKSLRLYTGHEIATGVVTADIIDGSSTYYEVEIDGKTYTGKTSDKVRKEDAIDIAYLPASPNINRPKKSLWNDTVTLGLVIAAITIVLLLMINDKYLSKKETHEE